MNSLISVIIPCYNVAPFIHKCLDSVLKQSYKNLEIIVIDDGSTDDTASILQNFYSDNRVKIISKENAGVSAARNKGIDYATGDFITFVDSDDWLEPTMYEKLYFALIDKNADLAVCNYNLAYDTHLDRQYSMVRNETVKVKDYVYGYFSNYCACPKPNNYIWTRLYKSEIIKNAGIRFENFKLGDDTLFNFKLLPHINRVTWISEGLYNYYQRSNSNVYTIAKKSNLATIYADTFDALANYYEQNHYNEFIDALPIHAFSRLRSVFFYSRLAGMREEAIVENVNIGFRGRKIYDYLTGVAK